MLYDYASNVVTKKTSYYPGGAMRVDVVGGSNTLYYLLKDHLGSASVVLDSSGALIANGEQRYYPYGENRITTAALPTDRLYTGQLELASLGGIYSYGARFHSPYNNAPGFYIDPVTGQIPATLYVGVGGMLFCRCEWWGR